MNCFHAYAATFAKGPLEPFSFNPGRSTFMANSSRPNVIRLLAFTVSALVLAATSRRSSSHRLPNRWPRPAASIPLGKSRESATPGTQICWEREAFRWRVWHTIKITRTWEWDQKTGTVSYEGKDKEGKPLKVTYQRHHLTTNTHAIFYSLLPPWPP